MFCSCWWSLCAAEHEEASQCWITPDILFSQLIRWLNQGWTFHTCYQNKKHTVLVQITEDCGVLWRPAVRLSKRKKVGKSRILHQLVIPVESGDLDAVWTCRIHVNQRPKTCESWIRLAQRNTNKHNTTKRTELNTFLNRKDELWGWWLVSWLESIHCLSQRCYQWQTWPCLGE